jgi:hypothetical protein
MNSNMKRTPQEVYDQINNLVYQTQEYVYQTK